jgi:hypothetical protein
VTRDGGHTNLQECWRLASGRKVHFADDGGLAWKVEGQGVPAGVRQTQRHNSVNVPYYIATGQHKGRERRVGEQPTQTTEGSHARQAQPIAAAVKKSVTLPAPHLQNTVRPIGGGASLHQGLSFGAV